MKRKIQIVLGCLLGVLLVWLLFRKTDWGEVYASMRNAGLGWLLVSQLPIWGSFFARVLRWRYIVRAVKPVPFRTLFNATQIGFLANFVLPLRAGELIRAFLLGRRADIPLSKGVALVAMDRVTDLFGLAGCMAVALLAYDASRDVVLPVGTLGNDTPITVTATFIRTGALTMSAVLVGLVVLLVLLYINQRTLLRLVDRVFGWISGRLAAQVQALLQQFAEGLHVFRSAADMTKSIAWSMVTWGFFALSAVCMLEAFHVPYPWYTPFLMQTILALVVSVPGAPGFLGQFHLGVVVSLLMVMPDMAPSEAKAIAIVVHLLNLIPVVMAGLLSLMLENTGLLELTRSSTKAAVEAPSK